MKWVSNEMCDHRNILCGLEENHWIEIWRNLRIRYNGDRNKVVDVGGFPIFSKFPKCHDEDKLVQHP